MEVQILVDGRPAMTAPQAARARGITPAGMRAVLRQNGVRPIAELDERTPLYDAAEIDRLNPPGRGNYRRKG